jgi:hypothetical protein
MVTLKVTYKPGHSRWVNDRTRIYEFTSQEAADLFADDYWDDIESVETA